MKLQRRFNLSLLVFFLENSELEEVDHVVSKAKGRTIRKVIGVGVGKKKQKKIHARVNAKKKKLVQRRR